MQDQKELLHNQKKTPLETQLRHIIVIFFNYAVPSPAILFGAAPSSADIHSFSAFTFSNSYHYGFNQNNIDTYNDDNESCKQIESEFVIKLNQ